MSAWQIYLITRLDEVVIILTAAAAALTIGLCIMGFMCLVERTLDRLSDIPGALRPVMKRMAIALAILWPLALLVPDTKEAAAMVVIPRLMESETVKEFPKWVRPLLEMFMEKEK